MKKFFVLALISMFCLASQAQIVSSRSTRITRETHKPFIFMDLGSGAYTGDADGVGIDLGFRWNTMFTENFGWDILKASAQTGVDDFVDKLCFQGKTGIRGVTPVLFGNSTLYANFAGGFGYFLDPDEFGFVWEFGAGVNFTPNFSLGVNFNNGSFEKHGYDNKIGLVTLRASYGF